MVGACLSLPCEHIYSKIKAAKIRRLSEDCQEGSDLRGRGRCQQDIQPSKTNYRKADDHEIHSINRRLDSVERIAPRGIF